MTRLLGPVGVLVGVVAVIIGALLQASGAAGVVFCSVIGGGILLIVVGGGLWLIRALGGRGRGLGRVDARPE